MFRDEELQGVNVTFQDVNMVLGAEASIRRKLTSKANQAEYSLDQIHGRSSGMTQVLKLALKYSKEMCIRDRSGSASPSTGSA